MGTELYINTHAHGFTRRHVKVFAVRGSMAPMIAEGLTRHADKFQKAHTAQKLQFVRSLFKHSEFENCALLTYCAATSGNYLPTFPENHIGPIFRGQESKKGCA